MFKQLGHFSNWLSVSTVGYKQFCKQNILSMGVVELNKDKTNVSKFIPPTICYDDFKLNPDTDMVFYHLRIPFDRKTDSVVLNNIHPFIFDDRFICMHNGLFYFKPKYKQFILPEYLLQIKGTTDSEQFFALWLSYFKIMQNMEDAFKEACKFVKSNSSMNLVIYDKEQNKLYIYRSKKMNTFVPPVYITDIGFTNFKVPNSKTIPKDTFLSISPTIA